MNDFDGGPSDALFDLPAEPAMATEPANPEYSELLVTEGLPVIDPRRDTAAQPPPRPPASPIANLITGIELVWFSRRCRPLLVRARSVCIRSATSSF